MQIKITRNTVVNGKPVVVGDVVDVSDRDGKMLISYRKAVAYKKPGPKSKK